MRDLLDAIETPLAMADVGRVQAEPITSSALVLNPKSDGDVRTPLCPECREEITRVESGGSGELSMSVVEFRCGCEELQRFEFSNE